MANDSTQSSGLDTLIPAEIRDDEFYRAIQEIVQREAIETILEIGSSSGGGSTAAFVTALREHSGDAKLFCMEVSKTRFAELKQQYINDAFVHCYNVSSVPIAAFSTAEAVENFYQGRSTNLNVYPLNQVLGWLQQDIDYVKNSGVPEDGITIIKQEHHIDCFDVVLIDGSEFTGIAELLEVYGAKYIMLDDICTFKNYQNHQKLFNDPNYALIRHNPNLRHGYSIFQKISTDLPIHFFTIVLNGEPFIRYHIEVFRQLPFPWHWHIVEGVADLKHCSAWSLRLGGHITAAMHSNGLSNDGTTEYLDELQRQYPDNISIYRKSDGAFWDGALEMVNAPLTHIKQECLLWQVDVDEFWTIDQIGRMQQMFIRHPEKTAAFYWCWYFVGQDLVIATRNCYAENPQQEWLRTWRYQPGYRWISHSPPILAQLSDGQWQDVARINPFLHEETEAEQAIFQHFAYVTEKQLQFKEDYYGYKNARSSWIALQQQTRLPVRLRQYFPWVHDLTLVDKAELLGVMPIAYQNQETWHFHSAEALRPLELPQEPVPLIAIDAVFFQLHKTGIARVWQSLLQAWAESGFSKHLVVFDRAGTAPDIAGIRYVTIAPYNANATDTDRAMLQQVCDQIRADVLISTYFTTPLTTPAVLMVYDMIPEVMGESPNHPIVRLKRQAVEYASDYLAISQNTARDLEQFFPALNQAVKVAYCGVEPVFSPATTETVARFKAKYGMTKPYFLVMSADNPSPYKNNSLFFQAFSQLVTKTGFDIVCTAIAPTLPEDLREHTIGTTVHLLRLTDAELAVAYSGAIALVYPSKYEGFGMPVLEAMACGCPVITCANTSIPEVAGAAVLYVADDHADQLADALCEVQKPIVRSTLIAAGLKQAQQFSWTTMAETVSSVLVESTLPPLNLRSINLTIFPNWHVPEAMLYEALESALGAVLTHPDQSLITLLVDVSDVPNDLDPDLILADVVMNLLMQTEIPTDEPEIALVSLSLVQWQALSQRLQGYIALETAEATHAKTIIEHCGLKLMAIANLQKRRAIQSETDVWELR
jgi:glycosyltransferase involved in cell wall biosynthesis